MVTSDRGSSASIMREPIPHRRLGTVMVPALTTGLFALVCAFAAAVAAMTIEDLRGDTPTVEAARRELSLVLDEREYLMLQLDVADARLNETAFENERLDIEAQGLLTEIEELTYQLQSMVVETYVIGGNSDLEFVADVATTNDLLWRQSLLNIQKAESQAAINRLSALRASAAEDVLVIIDKFAALRRTVADLESQIDELNGLESAAIQDLTVALAWDRVAIALADDEGWGIAPADKWANLKFCESGGNYQAVSPSGRYRGAFQFDIVTWQSVGGKGDPAEAPPEEQEARARELYDRRGPEPWPKCGSLLY